MQFDIIKPTGTELSMMSTKQMKLLRAAQQKKNELYHKAEIELKAFSQAVMAAGMKYSTLVESKRAELQEELDYQTAVLKEEVIYDITVCEPVAGDDPGEDEGVDDSVGYTVDYKLSYNERYKIVRDYYLAIPDPTERMNLYRNDETAKKYLSSYYTTLYDVLTTYSK